MTIKDLINKLSKFDSSLEVGLCVSNDKPGKADRIYVAGKKTIEVEHDNFMVKSLQKTVWISGYMSK